MSTRATVHFCDKGAKKPVAIIYRHSDGYPDGLGKDLQRFLETVKKNVQDTRFNDPTYLSAKWVVFDANEHMQYAHPLAFLGVGILNKDPGDIEYRYIVECGGGPLGNSMPKVTCQKVS